MMPFRQVIQVTKFIREIQVIPVLQVIRQIQVIQVIQLIQLIQLIQSIFIFLSVDWTSSRPRKRRICRSATPFSFIRIKLSRALTNQTLDCRSISQSDKWTSVHPLPYIFISQPPPTMLHILKYQGSSEHTVILLRELIFCHSS